MKREGEEKEDEKFFPNITSVIMNSTPVKKQAEHFFYFFGLHELV